jgi:uncharacterized RDD family membrane protein YckC
MTNPYAPPQAEVQDMTVPGASLMPAERSTRLGAAILDTLIVMAIVYLPILAGVGLSAGDAEPTGVPLPLLIAFAVAFMGFLTWAGVTIVYVTRNGQTIAKKWLGIKVVRVDGSTASLGRIFWLRNMLNGVISIIPLYGLVELLFIFGESRQCLHDKIANTIVVQA